MSYESPEMVSLKESPCAFKKSVVDDAVFTYFLRCSGVSPSFKGATII
jgi:hypothetical protein